MRLLLPVALALALQTPGWAVDCVELRQQRDQRAAKAMHAELTLLHTLRRRICPQQEALAGEDGAGLDFTAYIRCRREAEAELQRSRAVLHTNRYGFTYYTQEGADQAIQADALLDALEQQGCDQRAAVSGRRNSPSR